MTTYLSSSSVFMTNNTPSGVEKHRESAELESQQTAKMFSFFSSSDGLVGNCVTFMMAFAQNNSIYTEQCTS